MFAIIPFSAIHTNSNVFLILNHKTNIFSVLPILFLKSLLIFLINAMSSLKHL